MYFTWKFDVSWLSLGDKEKRNLKKIKNFISKEVALGKFGKPREIFQMINYLSSNESDFVTGSNFVIDGGQVNDFKTF